MKNSVPQLDDIDALVNMFPGIKENLAETVRILEYSKAYELMSRFQSGHKEIYRESIVKLIICVLAICLNSISLYKTAANRSFHRRTHFLLPFNLALCDLLMALVLPLEIYSTFNGKSYKALDESVYGTSTSNKLKRTNGICIKVPSVELKWGSA